MPAINSFILTDAATTPVTHTFIPDGKEPSGKVKFTEYGSVPIGRSWATVDLSKRTNSQYFDYSFRVGVPIVRTQTVNGVDTPVVLATNVASLVFRLSDLSSEQERKNLVKMAQTALDSTQGFLYPMPTQLLRAY